MRFRLVCEHDTSQEFGLLFACTFVLFGEISIQQFRALLKGMRAAITPCVRLERIS